MAGLGETPHLKNLQSWGRSSGKTLGALWANHSLQWASVSSSVNWADKAEPTEKASVGQLFFTLEYLISFLLKTVVLVEEYLSSFNVLFIYLLNVLLK